MSILAILDVKDIKENYQSNHLEKLSINDLFLETNYKANTKNIILCKDHEFKILKKWSKTSKESKVYDIAYLNKVVTSL